MNLLMRISLLLIIIAVTGCASKEYKVERKACSNKAGEEFPPKIISKIGTCYKTIEIPYRTDCDTYADGYGGFSTRCSQKTKNERIPYSCTTEIDLNKSARTNYIASCVKTSCIERYGNKSCDVEKRDLERDYKRSVSSFDPISYEDFKRLESALEELSFWDFEEKEPIQERLDIYCKQQGRKKYNDVAGRCYGK